VEFKSWKVQEIFLFSKMPRVAMGPIQPPIHWILGVLSPWVKHLQHVANHLPLSVDKVKYDGNHASSLLICLLGMCRDNFFWESYQAIIKPSFWSVGCINLGVYLLERVTAFSMAFSQVFAIFIQLTLSGGHVVAQLVEALRFKPEGRGFYSQWCHWNFSLT